MTTPFTPTAEELQAILAKHRAWWHGEPGGERADLRDADLSGADLSGANLSGANLSRANLRGADLSRANLSRANLSRADLSDANLRDADLRDADLRGADLRRANLSRADLSDANLRGADLSDADLSDADLRGADLSATCLDDNLRAQQRAFCRQCPPLRTGGRIVYRTRYSQHVNAGNEYIPGKTYVAPALSADVATACHPGIYAASLEWMQEEFGDRELVRCYVRDGDWFISAKGAIRCKRLRVLAAVQS
jgi:hypothetical protein